MIVLERSAQIEGGPLNSSTDLWYGTSGPPDAEIVIVGEAWGDTEAQAKKPFMGSAGTELNRMLAEAGLRREDILCTNVVAARPQGNDMWRFFHDRDNEDKARRLRGLYPTDLVLGEMRRLGDQIRAHPRRLVIAAGNYSLWALTNCAGVNNGKKETSYRKTPKGIMDWRGSMWWMLDNLLDNSPTPTYSTTQLLPIIHPAAIMRAWYNRAPTVHDLKARVPLAMKGDWSPRNQLFWAPPTFEQACLKLDYWYRRAQVGPFKLASDVETVRQQFISCWGFSDSRNFAMSIPFVKPIGPKQIESYWSPKQEAEIVYRIRKVMSHPNVLIVGQNHLYDIQWAQEWFCVTPKLHFDTMLAQNVIFPGTPKDLAYLSSMYCHYHWYWKEDNKDWSSVDDLPSLLRYNCIDNVQTLEISDSQEQVLKQLGLEEQMRIKMQINDLCLEMMNRGINFDKKRSVHLAMELAEARRQVHTIIEQIVPQSVIGESKTGTRWYTSDKQTAEMFYDILGFPVVKDRKTGNRTVNKEALNVLTKKVPIWKPLLDCLRMERSLENTYNVITARTDRDGRMRCFFGPGGTETHRLNSSKNAFGGGMNLQNLTKGKED